jgi:hypothetical protein
MDSRAESSCLLISSQKSSGKNYQRTIAVVVGIYKALMRIPEMTGFFLLTILVFAHSYLYIGKGRYHIPQHSIDLLNLLVKGLDFGLKEFVQLVHNSTPQ